MKKSILALALVAAMGLFSACGGDNNDYNNGISGNLTKEPVSGAQVAIKDVNGKILATTTSALDGSIFFEVPKANYFVELTSLSGAKLMDKVGGSDIPAMLGAFFNVNDTIAVPAGMTAQFNPIGVTAYNIVEANLPQGASDEDGFVFASTVIKNIANNLSAMTSDLVARFPKDENAILVNGESILAGHWSANIEYVLQFYMMVNRNPNQFNFSDLNTINYDNSILAGYTDAELQGFMKEAVKKANAAADATGRSHVKSEEVSQKIVKLIVRNSATTPSFNLFYNGKNATAYTVNGSVYGVNASNYASGNMVGKFIPAEEVSSVTISEANKGITLDTRSSNDFALKISDKATGSYTVEVMASFKNATVPGLYSSFAINLNASPSPENLSSLSAGKHIVDSK